jgi:flagellar FliL protein
MNEEPAEAAQPEASGEAADAGDDQAKKKDKSPRSRRGLIQTIIAAGAVTVVGAGLGIVLGFKTASGIEQAIAARRAAEPAAEAPIRSIKYSGDLVLKTIDPVITNLAEPSDVWVRLETAMIFDNGKLENPDVTAAEIQQDIMSYLRTMSLAQFESPSALQHLREDLNERVAVRTGGQVKELILKALIVQ